MGLNVEIKPGSDCVIVYRRMNSRELIATFDFEIDFHIQSEPTM